MSGRRKKTIATPSGPAEAEVIDVNSSNENFNNYMLADGTVLKLKTVLVEVLRVDGMWDEEGNPAYVVKTKQVVTADSPSELRRNKT